MRHEVHICLVSDRPTPNLTPLLEPKHRPNEVVLVVGPQTEREAAWLQSAIESSGIRVSRFGVRCVYTIEHLRDRFMELLAENEGTDLVLNATGGTKPMSIAAYEVFRGFERPIFYVDPDFDQLVWLWHPDKPGPHQIADRIKLPLFMKAHGAVLETEGPKSGVPASRRDACKALISRADRYGEAFAYVNYLAYRSRQSLKSPKIERPTRELAEVLEQFREMGALDVKGGRLVFPSEEDRFFVNGGWLEAWIFSEVYSLRKDRPNVQDLGRGVQFARAIDGKPVRNEIDVAFLADNRIYLVEAKTKRFGRGGRDDRSGSGSGALYKLDTLRELFGGEQARAMLVSFQPISDAVRRRATDLGIKAIAGSELTYFRESLESFVPAPRGAV